MVVNVEIVLSDMLYGSKYFFFWSDIDYSQGCIELDYAMGVVSKTVYIPFYINNIYIKL